MKKAILISIVLVGLLLNSCSLDDDGQNFHFVSLKVLSADVPDSFELNQTYEIPFSFERTNGCVFYEGMDDRKPELTEREFYPVGRQLTGNVACTDAVEEVDASFRFQVLYDEPYVFKFFTGVDDQNEATFIEFTIPVEQPSSSSATKQ